MSPNKPGSKTTAKRQALTAERIIDGAVALADEIGIAGFTIRRLAEAIDAKPMSIYHHLPNKEAIIDGMVDRVFSEIELPPVGGDWRAAITIRSHSMREVLGRHRWAPPLMEARTSPGPATLRHHDAVLGCFRDGGFSLALTGHAYATLDAFLYGFAMQEATLPATGGEEMDDLASTIVAEMPTDLFPHLAEFTKDYVLQPGYDYSKEFDVGLELILDGLQRRHGAEQ